MQINDGNLSNKSLGNDLKECYEIYEIENFSLKVFHFNNQIAKNKFYHNHLDYEFVILLTTLKGILFEDNKYIGEATGGNDCPVEEAGLQRLNGKQALSYARIRKGVGDDYERTEAFMMEKLNQFVQKKHSKKIQKFNMLKSRLSIVYFVELHQEQKVHVQVMEVVFLFTIIKRSL